MLRGDLWWLVGWCLVKRRSWVRSTAECVAASLEDSLDMVSVAKKKSVVSETFYFEVLGM